MKDFLLQLAFVLGGVGAIVKLIDFWIPVQLKNILRTKIENVWFKFVDEDPIIVARTPLLLLSKMFDAFYGDKISSWRGFWRSSILSGCILLSSLALTGIITGNPFAIETTPGQSFDKSFSLLESFQIKIVAESKNNVEKAKIELTDAEKNPKNHAALQQARRNLKTKQDAQKLIEGFIGKITFFRTPAIRAFYSLSIFSVVPILALVLNFTCIGIARKILREMLVAGTELTLMALVVLNIFACSLVYLLCLFSICVISVPLAALIQAVLFYIGFHVNLALTLTLMVPALLWALWWGPIWVKVISIIAAFPSMLLAFVSLLGSLLFPIRDKIHSFALLVLDRCVGYKDGVLIFLYVLLLGVVSLISCIARLMGGFAG